jgi:sigma-E factor negative regulatory protein RseA
MTEPIKEQLSAFLDNELPKPELELLLKRLGADSELRGSLERYVLIGESLRASPQAQVSRKFAERVRAAVEQESAPLPAPARAPRWAKPLTGFAVAAGAAAGAVLMVRFAPLDSLDLTAKEDTRSPIELARNVPVEPTPPALAALDEGQRWQSVSAVSATQLTHYVVAHSEYSSPLERRNVLTGVLGEARPVNDVIELESASER